MKKIIAIFFIVLTTGSVALAQKTENRKEFTSKPIVTVFSNYHYGLGDESDNSGFELDRAYLGYGFDYKGELSSQLVLDFGSTKLTGSALEMVAFLKNAFVTWKKDAFEASFGLIKTNNFGFQESFWSYRYVAKSFQDEEGFAPSADFGMSAAYKFTDWLKADLQITNGEGYKKIILDNSQRYGLGLTFEPLKKLYVRGHYDVYVSGADGLNPEHTLSAFVGYKHSRFSLGAEYNYKWNKKFTTNTDNSGASVYTTIKLVEKLAFFARYDYTQDSDKQSNIYSGVEYAPYKYLKISPNVKSEILHNGKDNATFLYLNIQIKI